MRVPRKLCMSRMLAKSFLARSVVLHDTAIFHSSRTRFRESENVFSIGKLFDNGV